MAIVVNVADHPVSLTGGGVLAPDEQRNIDVSAAHELALIDDGSLVVIDPGEAPEVPDARPVTVDALRPFGADPEPFTIDLSDVEDPESDGRVIGVDGQPVLGGGNVITAAGPLDEAAVEAMLEPGGTLYETDGGVITAEWVKTNA